MKCFGPPEWCSFIESRVGSVTDRELVIISLNPTRQFDTHVEQLQTELGRGKTVITYSLTSRADLDRDPTLAALLAQTTFIQGPHGSVVDHILHTLPRH